MTFSREMDVTSYAMHGSKLEQENRWSSAQLRRVCADESEVEAVDESFGECAVIIAAEGTIAGVSAEGATLLGAASGEIIGNPMLGFIADGDREAFARSIDRVMNGEGISLHHTIVCADGGHIAVVSRLSPRRDRRGHADGVALSITPLTAEKKSCAEMAWRMLVEQIPAIVYATDTAGRLRYVSSQIESLGYAPEEWMAGDLPFTSIHPDDRERVDGERSAARESRTPFRSEYRLRARTGAYRWIRDEARGVGGGGGEARFFQGVMTDITEAKESELALRESEERYRDLVEQSSDLIGTHALDGTFLSVNDAMVRATGYSREQLLGMSIGDILDPSTRDSFFAYVEKMALLGRASGIMKICTASGEVRYFEYDNSVRRGLRPHVRGIARDVTSRIIAERERASVARRDDALIAALGEVVYEWDLASDALKLYGESPAVLGSSAGEIGLDRSEWMARIHVDDVAAVGEIVAEALRERRAFDLEYRFRGCDGTYRWMQDRGVLTVDRLGRIKCVIGVVTNVHDRHLAHEAIRRQEALLRTVIETLPVGVWIVDEAGAIVEGNQSGKQIWRGARYVGIEDFGEYKAWWLPSRKPIAPEEWAAARAIRKGETSLDELIEIEAFDGTHRLLRNSAVPLRSADGAITGAVVVNQDVTDEVEIHAQLQSAHDRLRSVLRQENEAREAARRHLARELHDEVGQLLTATKINLQMLARTPALGAFSPRLVDSIGLVDRALDELRALTLELRPPLLDDLGVAPALRWISEQQSLRSGIDIRCESSSAERRFDPSLEIACFRIAQEALNNVVRHSRATAADVRLELEGETLHLRVTDRGAGFDVAAARQRAVQGGSLGLLGMEERASLAGGTLSFRSSPGNGCEVHAVFPTSVVEQART